MRKQSNLTWSRLFSSADGLKAVAFSLATRVVRHSGLAHLREVVLVVGAYFVYMYSRKLVFSDVEVHAFENAERLVDFLKAVGFLWEPVIQDWILGNARYLIYALNWAYIITFWPIVLSTAIFFYLTNRQVYRHYRNMVLLSFGVALVIFMLFPLAPPRMLPGEGFVDTVKNFGPNFYNSREARTYFNAFAAMPSIHFAWTLLFGYLFYRTGRPGMKVAGLLYPVFTLVAIVSTANHYVLDALGGAFVAGSVFLVYRYLLYRKPLPKPEFALPWRKRDAKAA